LTVGWLNKDAKVYREQQGKRELTYRHRNIPGGKFHLLAAISEVTKVRQHPQRIILL